ncbi:Protein Y39F10A.3 [Aphelenchoides avenae]|nr:Protein Y39F10A.3 [Aphelenchus avenae]
MARLGSLLDGGKWVCNPQYYPTDHCVVYAVGLNNEISFEEALLGFTQRGCAHRAIDKDDQSSETLIRLSRIKATPFQAFIAPQDDAKQRMYSFTSIMKHFGDRSIEVLKFDAEGAEQVVIDQILQVPICQFLVEVHGTASAFHTYKFLEKVSKAGFYLFFSELNAFEPGNLREYSFIS